MLITQQRLTSYILDLWVHWHRKLWLPAGALHTMSNLASSFSSLSHFASDPYQIFRTLFLILLKSICLAGLITHTVVNFYGYFYNPTRWVKTRNVRLRDLEEFPFVLQAIIHPGFDMNALAEEGYKSVDDYFMGQSRFNCSAAGWRGTQGQNEFKWCWA